jgi:hypothetical protein
VALGDSFDLVDPLGAAVADPVARLEEVFDRIAPRRPRRRRRPTQTSQLSPEEEESLLRSIGSQSAGLVSGVASALDVPGSYVRGLISGLTGGPWAMGGPPEKRVYGRDILERWGWIGRNRYRGLRSFTDWRDLAGDIAGFTFDVLTDPLTWLSFGVLGGAGKGLSAARKAGLLQTSKWLTKAAAKKVGRTMGPRQAAMHVTLAELMREAPPAVRRAAAISLKSQMPAQAVRRLARQPVGGLIGVGLPFREPALALGKAGGPAESIARALDVAGRRLRYSAPGRVGAMLFSRYARSPYSRELQQAAADITIGQDLARPEALGKVYGVLQRVERLVTDQANPIPGDTLNEMFARAVEIPPGQSPSGPLTKWLQTELGKLPQHQRAAFQSTVDEMIRLKDELYRAHQELGLYSPELADAWSRHFPRYLAQIRRGRRPRRLADTSWESVIRRKAFLRNVPEGRSVINAMAADARLAGPDKLPIDQAAAIIRGEYGVVSEKDALALARYFANRGDDLFGEPVFGSPIRDFARYMITGHERLEVGRALLQFMADNARHVDEAGELVSLPEALQKMGFVLDANKNVHPNALEQLRTLMGLASADDLRQFGLPAELVEEATRLMQGFTVPHVLRPLLEAFDSFTALWKAFHTSPWFAFQGRNRLSGLFQNWVAGGFDPKIERMVRRLITTGQPMTGLSKYARIRRELAGRGLEINDINATELVKELAFKHEVIGRYYGMAYLEPAGSTLGELTFSVPGRRPVSPLQALAAYVPRSRQQAIPWNIRGVFGRAESAFAPVRGGELMGYYVESMNRLPPFLKYWLDGMDEAVAAAKVRASQVGYAGRYYTEAERQVFARLFPFYKFSRGMLPFVLRELAERPGGRLAQTLRLTHYLRGRGEPLPEYVAQTTAIPVPFGTPLLGPGSPGFRRFITAGGLMHEDPLAFLTGGRKAAGLEMLSRLNPMLKGPLEYLTGQTFFQRGPTGGRRLEDMDPALGRLLANLRGLAEPARVAAARKPVRLPLWFEQLSANMPWSRFVTTLRTLTDPRKRIRPDVPIPGLPTLVNLLSGVRVMDVSEAAIDKLIRDAIQQRMQDTGIARRFERVYIPLEEIERLPPRQARSARSLNYLMNLLAQRAGARARGLPPPPMGLRGARTW